MSAEYGWFDREKAQAELLVLFKKEIAKAYRKGYDDGYETGTEEGFVCGNRHASA